MASPKQVYDELTAQGASSVQALGIMANIINESGFNPEAVGDQGTSFGIVQQHGSQYAGLVTGNEAADLKAQVRVIAQNGGFRAASGSTPAEAAGNFAANYERCVGCQPGGAQYNSRVANAATVTGWASSGKWPASAGSAQAAQTTAAQQAQQLGSTCIIGFGGVPGTSWINDIFGSGGNVGQFCLFSKSEARAVVGGLIMVASGSVALVGVLILAAYGLKKTGALEGAAKVASVVPAGRGVAAGLSRVSAAAG